MPTDINFIALSRAGEVFYDGPNRYEAERLAQEAAQKNNCEVQVVQVMAEKVIDTFLPQPRFSDLRRGDWFHLRSSNYAVKISGDKAAVFYENRGLVESVIPHSEPTPRAARRAVTVGNNGKYELARMP